MESTSDRPHLALYLIGGFFVAVGLSTVALIGIAIFFALTLAGVETAPVEWRELLVGLPVIFLSYLVLSQLGALALWTLYPLKRSIFTSMLRGAILGTIVYGTVGLSSVLLYVNSGIDLIGYTSHADAWASLRFMLPIFAAIGAFIGGPVIYFKFRE